jgi:hypothetical protein
MAILPDDQLILLQVGDVVVRLLGIQLEDEPPDVGVEKTFRDAVGIIVVIDVYDGADVRSPTLGPSSQRRRPKTSVKSRTGQLARKVRCEKAMINNEI